MKHILVTAALPLALAGVATAKELKVLTIGNSFSICLIKEFPSIVHHAPEHKLTFTGAWIGGCPLDLHWRNIEASEKDPEARQYDVITMNSEGDPKKEDYRKDSLNAVIKEGGWDIISIQQASPKSWDYDTYQPYAQNLIAYIREHAPGAEIVIQQTWSYHKDDGRLIEGNAGYWGFDQNGMFERIRDAYKKLAEDSGNLRVIPVGEAVQNVRTLGGDDVVGYQYENDTIHLSKRGEYLQACVWFGALFGDDPVTIKFVPPNIAEDDAKALQAAAQKALSEQGGGG